MNVAVIPARGGSKRIPRKNIKPVGGRPMLAWPIRAALASGCFERVVVSTDDEEIAELACANGAEVPFLRPAALADDFATTTVVMAHAVQWLVDTGTHADNICCLYPTALFVQPADLQHGLALLASGNCDFVFTATSYAFPIARAFRLLPGNHVEMFAPQHLETRSQDLEEAFHDAAQFYWGTRTAWLERKPIFSAHSVALVLPRFRVQDIDTPEDLVRAEWMFNQINDTPELLSRDF